MEQMLKYGWCRVVCIECYDVINTASAAYPPITFTDYIIYLPMPYILYTHTMLVSAACYHVVDNELTNRRSSSDFRT